MNWWQGLKAKIKFDEPLKDKTTFKIGGKAKYFIEPKDTSDLRRVIILAKKFKIPVFVIGAGSNILVSDSGLNALILRLNSNFFKKISVEGNRLNIAAGTLLNQLVRTALLRGLSGAEFLSGIPGTVGGALAMNAGAWGRSISDIVESVRVMDYGGNIKTFNRGSLKFGYRKSSLSKYIILGAQIKLKAQDKTEIKHRIEGYLSQRKARQDLTKPSAGCIFKNPAGYPCGRLIEECGLKGKRMGGASISKRHANFILNETHAKSADVLRLISLMRRKVKQKFNLNLQTEIKIWQ